jgi:hypothetical protein
MWFPSKVWRIQTGEKYGLKPWPTSAYGIKVVGNPSMIEWEAVNEIERTTFVLLGNLSRTV